MRVINFLPNDYMVRRGLRRANLICLAIGGGAAVVIGIVVAGMFVRTLGTAAMRAIVDKQYEQASLRIAELQQLEDRRVGLLHKVELSTALLERVPRSVLLARLTNHLPADTSLTAMQMRQEDVAVAIPAPAAPPGTAPGAKDAGKPTTKKVSYLRFRLDGLAKTDVQVAQYLSNLGADPLFEDIDLQFSEEFPYQEGVTMRRFQVCFLLSQDAAKALQASATTEQAAAAPAAASTKGKS